MPDKRLSIPKNVILFFNSHHLPSSRLLCGESGVWRTRCQWHDWSILCELGPSCPVCSSTGKLTNKLSLCHTKFSQCPVLANREWQILLSLAFSRSLVAVSHVCYIWKRLLQIEEIFSTPSDKKHVHQSETKEKFNDYARHTCSREEKIGTKRKGILWGKGVPLFCTPYYAYAG